MTQSLQRDYEKLRAQLDQARRKAIGSAGMAGTVGEVGDGCYVPASTHSASTSAPQPFYAGVSVCMQSEEIHLTCPLVLVSIQSTPPSLS